MSDEADDEGGCWFRFGGNQVMRNVALARTLVSGGAAAFMVMALCAPAGHRSIWRRWAEVKGRLAVPGVSLRELPAEAVVHHHADPTAIAQRYMLDLSRGDVRCLRSRFVSFPFPLEPLLVALVGDLHVGATAAYPVPIADAVAVPLRHAGLRVPGAHARPPEH